MGCLFVLLCIAIPVAIGWYWWTVYDTVHQARDVMERYKKLTDNLVIERDKQQSEIDSLLLENDTIKRDRDEMSRQANEWADRLLQQSNENGLLESRCTELQRIIDDYRRWIRESVKLMPDSVKHVSDIQLIERHRPRPAEVSR